SPSDAAPAAMHTSAEKLPSVEGCTRMPPRSEASTLRGFDAYDASDRVWERRTVTMPSLPISVFENCILMSEQDSMRLSPSELLVKLRPSACAGKAATEAGLT